MKHLIKFNKKIYYNTTDIYKKKIFSRFETKSSSNSRFGDEQDVVDDVVI